LISYAFQGYDKHLPFMGYKPRFPM
jgi:hypothetical protein